MKLTRYTAEFYLPSDVDSSAILDRLQTFARECCEDSSELTDIASGECDGDSCHEDPDDCQLGEALCDDIMQAVEDHCSITDTQIAKDHTEIGRL